MEQSKPSPFWSSEKLLSLTAVFISIATLVVFLYQTNLIRQQQYMSVYPYLSIGNYGTGTKNYRYVLENKGIGPAVIKSVSLESESGEFYDDFEPFVDKILLENDSIRYFHSNIRPGRLISPNELIELIGVKDNQETSRTISKILNSELKGFEIEYESIYGERWIINGESEFPLKK